VDGFVDVIEPLLWMSRSQHFFSDECTFLVPARTTGGFMRSQVNLTGKSGSNIKKQLAELT
jgi:hypothetical protein